MVSVHFRNPLAGLSPQKRRQLIGLAAFYVSFIIVVQWIGPENIFHYFVQLARWLAAQPYGKLIVLGMIVILSFPPTVGYSSSITLCGLAYGSKATKTPSSPNGHSVWEGWSLAVAGAMLGSSLAFLTLRFLMRTFRDAKWIRDVKASKQWAAMDQAIQDRGFKMLLLIRWCPFPFVYSNLVCASLDGISFVQFFFATLLSTPRLLLHVYIGGITFDLLDKDQYDAMPQHVKIINGLSIFVGILLGIGTSWYLWRTMQRILNLEETQSLLPTSRARGRDSGEVSRDHQSAPITEE